MKSISSRARQQIRNEEKERYLRHEYAIYKDIAYSFGCYSIAGLLTVMARRGRTKKYIQDLFNDMCFVFSQKDVFGKEITMTDVMKDLTKKYEIDWKKLEVNIETEKEFLKGMK